MISSGTALVSIELQEDHVTMTARPTGACVRFRVIVAVGTK